MTLTPELKKILKRKRIENTAPHIESLTFRPDGRHLTMTLPDSVGTGTSGRLVSDPKDKFHMALDWGAGPGGGEYGPHYHDVTEMIIIHNGYIENVLNGKVTHAGESIAIPPGEIHGYTFSPNTRATIIFTPPLKSYFVE